MKVIIISDSHGNSAVLEDIFRKERNADAVIHLGDGCEDLWGLNEYIGRLPVYKIKGNNDRYLTDIPPKLISYIGEIRFFACHGHLLDVKMSLIRLRYTALENDCKIAFFGHTHIPYKEETDGITLFNPGCSYKGNYGTLETKGEKFTLTLKNIYD